MPIIDLKTQGDCGKECPNCGLFRSYCPGCITRICLVAKCKRGISYSGITHPTGFCRLQEYCHSLGSIPDDIAQTMPKLKVRIRVRFPRFVPVVRLTDKSSWFWNDLPLPWIVVRLAEFIKNKTLIQRVVSRGLHDFLGFNGKILLSTVMEDELLDELTSKDYIGMINEIRPDATMTPDSYTYLDDPLCLSWEQTLKQAAFSRAFSELDIPVVGLIKGVIWKQIAWSAERAIELGCGSFAIPSRELAEEGFLDGVISAVTTALRRGKEDAQLLLYGLSYPLRKSKGKFAYSGLSWFIGAKNGFYYKRNDSFLVTDASIRSEECHCAVLSLSFSKISSESWARSFVKEIMDYGRLDQIGEGETVIQGQKVEMEKGIVQRGYPASIGKNYYDLTLVDTGSIIRVYQDNTVSVWNGQAFVRLKN